MALAFTEKIELGYKAPYFELPEPLTGVKRSLNELKGEWATVVMFICNHCPYVKHVNSELVKLASEYIPKGIGFIAINSNDVVKYQEDAPEKMKEVAKTLKYPFPYLFDESQEIAKKYFAVCTPDFSIFNNELNCVYRGQLDESRPGNNVELSGTDIRKALDLILKDKPVNFEQKPSVGCSIKWKM